MDDLSGCVDAIESRYFLHETLDRGITITVKNEDGSTSPVSFPVENRACVEKLTPILKNASVSPFGVGSETVVDTSVRNALHLLPEQFTSDFDPLEEGILDRIRETLVPEASEVTATLLKLNVYSKGGHFQLHKDTPRGENCFGSLVVCLPAPFSGGDLKLHHSGSNDVIDLAKGNGPSFYIYGKTFLEMHYTPETKLKWVAFFGDVDHEVREVTEGYRITLS